MHVPASSAKVVCVFHLLICFTHKMNKKNTNNMKVLQYLPKYGGGGWGIFPTKNIYSGGFPKVMYALSVCIKSFDPTFILFKSLGGKSFHSKTQQNQT